MRTVSGNRPDYARPGSPEPEPASQLRIVPSLRSIIVRKQRRPPSKAADAMTNAWIATIALDKTCGQLGHAHAAFIAFLGY
ncbi:hypothetical protein BOSEA31B_13221 [Hyphomicrobiales bacterium]|nr:hypothetical protein BOSEA31B_13221 [Hyphomicrobiales bacterium]CAH1698995.1 hypothetical protein BOSEA1005_12048 [Hyphomicrobiales bacterium]CAI0342639.1 hypothetical protein BO1005MUT1_190152 [Hyphomicrobiales bacterium]